MSEISAEGARGTRLALLIGGAAAVVFGLAILVWPTKAAVVVTGFIAAYAIIAGIVYVAVGVLSKALGVGGRIGHVLLGVLYVVAGAFAFAELQASAAFLAVFLTILVGVMWIVEGFVALFLVGASSSKALTIAFAVLSILAGFALLSSPLWGAALLWWFIAISLIVLGILNIARAFVGRKG